MGQNPHEALLTSTEDRFKKKRNGQLKSAGT